jgi:DNA repair exonuclease SbcCD ATPase subunit
MIELANIELLNFWSYKKAKLNFNYVNPVLVIGTVDGRTGGFTSNGAGKSALLEAVLWVLFGRTSQGVTADAIVNTSVNKDCRVTLKGQCKSGSFEISRHRKHSKHKNKLLLKINGIDCSRENTSETQKLIDLELEINYETVLHTCYFSQNSMFSLTDGQQKTLFDKILGLEVWDVAHERTKAILSDLEKMLMQLEAKSQHIQEARKRELENFLDVLGQHRRVEADVVNRLSSKIKTLQAVEERLKKISSNLEQYNNLDDEPLKQIEDKLNRVVRSRLKAQAEITVLNKRLSVVSKEMCDYCLQKIRNSSKRKKELNEEREGLKEKVSKLDYRTQKLETKRTLYQERLSDHKSLLNERDKLQEIFKDLSKQIKDIKFNNNLNTSDLVEKSAQYLKTLSSQRAKIKRRISDINSNIYQYNKIKQAFSKTGIRAYIIENALPLLNERLEKYSLQIMDNHIKIELRIDEEKNKIEPIVEKPTGGGYLRCSAGEKRRVDICVMLALLDLMSFMGKPINFVVFDELLDPVDPSGIEKTVELLQNLEQKNIFLISHRDDIKDIFQSIITIKNSKGISIIT